MEVFIFFNRQAEFALHLRNGQSVRNSAVLFFLQPSFEKYILCIYEMGFLFVSQKLSAELQKLRLIIYEATVL